MSLCTALPLGLFQPCFAQEVAQLNGPLTARTSGTIVTTPISDDGMDWLALQPAKQLMISFTSNGSGDVHVEVLNEQGDQVLACTRADHPGRTLLPLDVDGLGSGRYVLRVQQGGATRTARFLRP